MDLTLDEFITTFKREMAMRSNSWLFKAFPSLKDKVLTKND
jgi:hypothetical protein